MSLNWNVSACTNHKELVEGDEWTTTEILIWATIIVGVGDVKTEEVAREFYRRVFMWETVGGPLNMSGRRIAWPDVKRRIGLTTNASNMTPAKWRMKLEQLGMAEADRAAERLAKEAGQ